MAQNIPDPAAKLVLIALSDTTGDEHGNIMWLPEQDIPALAEATSLSTGQVTWALSALMTNGVVAAPYEGTAGQTFIRINMGQPVEA
jgi:hypothetical protein